jgi:hypothetical protein
MTTETPVEEAPIPLNILGLPFGDWPLEEVVGRLIIMPDGMEAHYSYHPYLVQIRQPKQSARTAVHLAVMERYRSGEDLLEVDDIFRTSNKRWIDQWGEPRGDYLEIAVLLLDAALVYRVLDADQITDDRRVKLWAYLGTILTTALTQAYHFDPDVCEDIRQAWPQGLIDVRYVWDQEFNYQAPNPE